MSYLEASKQAHLKFLKEYMVYLLEKYEGNLSRAAIEAKTHRSNLRRYLKQAGLDVAEFRKEGVTNLDRKRPTVGYDLDD